METKPNVDCIKIPSGCIPLFRNSDGLFLCLKGIKIVTVDLSKKRRRTHLLAIVPVSKKVLIGFLSHFSLAKRRLHLYPSTPILFNEGIYFSMMGSLFSFDLKTKKITQEISFRNGMRRTLSLTAIPDINSGKNALVFGEYFDNKSKQSVSIFKKIGDTSWKKVYSFPEGEIRHIHAIASDALGEKVFVFTGDDENEVKIVSFTNDFSNRKDIISGNQQIRTCSPFIKKDGSFIFATDSPFVQNGIYSFKQESSSLKLLSKIEGTCIYSARLLDNAYLFATCVEDNLRRNNNENIKIKIDGENGGILSKNAIIYLFKDDEICRLASYGKDSLPSQFGFGTYLFSIVSNGTIYCTPIALKTNKVISIKA
jgi:hypothetical protein